MGFSTYSRALGAELNHSYINRSRFQHSRSYHRMNSSDVAWLLGACGPILLDSRAPGPSEGPQSSELLPVQMCLHLPIPTSPAPWPQCMLCGLCGTGGPAVSFSSMGCFALLSKKLNQTSASRAWQPRISSRYKMSSCRCIIRSDCAAESDTPKPREQCRVCVCVCLCLCLSVCVCVSGYARGTDPRRRDPRHVESSLRLVASLCCCSLF